jgi:hypothetical protein
MILDRDALSGYTNGRAAEREDEEVRAQTATLAPDRVQRRLKWKY